VRQLFPLHLLVKEQRQRTGRCHSFAEVRCLTTAKSFALVIFSEEKMKSPSQISPFQKPCASNSPSHQRQDPPSERSSNLTRRISQNSSSTASEGGANEQKETGHDNRRRSLDSPYRSEVRQGRTPQSLPKPSLKPLRTMVIQPRRPFLVSIARMVMSNRGYYFGIAIAWIILSEVFSLWFQLVSAYSPKETLERDLREIGFWFAFCSFFVLFFSFFQPRPLAA